MITREFSERTNKIIGKLLFAFSLLNLAIAFWSYSIEREFVRNARPALGEVIEVQNNGSRPTIRYLGASGKKVNFQPKTRSSWNHFEIGDTVEVLRTFAEPSEVKLNLWFHLWGQTFATSLLSVMLGALAALTIAGKMRWAPLNKIRIIGSGS